MASHTPTSMATDNAQPNAVERVCSPMASHTPTTCGEHKLSVDEDGDGATMSARAQRAQWLRAAILGANDGLLSTTSLMLGVGAVKEDRWSMALTGAAGAVAGAFSMAVGEYVSVSTQRDIEMAEVHTKTTELPPPTTSPVRSVMKEEAPTLPSPMKAAAASGLAFIAGALVPLLSSVFIAGYMTRVLVLVIATSVALAGFGAAGAHLGGSPVRLSAARVLIGGWIAMAVTYFTLKPLDRDDWRR